MTSAMAHSYGYHAYAFHCGATIVQLIFGRSSTNLVNLFKALNGGFAHEFVDSQSVCRNASIAGRSGYGKAELYLALFLMYQDGDSGQRYTIKIRGTVGMKE